MPFIAGTVRVAQGVTGGGTSTAFVVNAPSRHRFPGMSELPCLASGSTAFAQAQAML